MTESYDSYFFHRAEVEMGMARRTCCPMASRIHAEMARRYLDLFYGRPASRMPVAAVPAMAGGQPTGRRARMACASVPSSR